MGRSVSEPSPKGAYWSMWTSGGWNLPDTVWFGLVATTDPLKETHELACSAGWAGYTTPASDLRRATTAPAFPIHDPRLRALVNTASMLKLMLGGWAPRAAREVIASDADGAG